MLNIEKSIEKTKLDFILSGSLDTTTAPELESEIKASIDGITDVSFDFNNLDYISSAGLRVLISTQKIMNKQGNMIIKNCKPEIVEIFEVTGFSDILTIQ